MHTIVFDFGNVVGFFDYHRAFKTICAHTDLSLADIEKALVGSALQDDYESGRITSDAFLKSAQELCRLRCSTELLAEAFADIFWPNPHVIDLLPRLRGQYRLLLGSNTCDIHARQFRRQFADSLRHFDALVLSHEIGARKPAAPFFEHCLSLAGCAPQECLFIDDLPANVAGAQRCGLQGLVYRGGDLSYALLKK